MDCDRGFSDDDHVLIGFFVELVFPKLVDVPFKTKWLRETIASYHNWNGFFVNERWHHITIKDHHNTLMKEVARRKKIIDVIQSNDTGYVESRKRMNGELAFVVRRLGLSTAYKKKVLKYDLDDNDTWETNKRLLSKDCFQLYSLLTSEDPKLVVHYLMMVALMFRNMKVCKRLRQSVTLYSFVDHVTHNVLQDSSNEPAVP